MVRGSEDCQPKSALTSLTEPSSKVAIAFSWVVAPMVTTGAEGTIASDLKAAVAGSPNAPQLHFLLGYFYWRWTRFEEAIAPLQEEIRINPGFAPAYFYLGDVRFRQGNAEEAAQSFAKTVAIDPAYGEAQLGLGKAYVDLKRPNDAVPLFRRAAELLPGHVEPYNWLGRTLVQLGRAEEGRKALDEVKRLNAARRESLPSILKPAAMGPGNSP